MRESWFFANAAQILLRWRDEFILVVDKLATNPKPNPFFDCSKSNTEAENEICSSIELSVFDRNVSQAYKFALSQYRGAGNDFRSLTLEKNGLRNAINVTQTGIVSFPQRESGWMNCQLFLNNTAMLIGLNRQSRTRPSNQGFN